MSALFLFLSVLLQLINFIGCFEVATFCFVDFLYGVPVLSFIHQLWRAYFDTCSQAWMRILRRVEQGKVREAPVQTCPFEKREVSCRHNFLVRKRKCWK